MLVTSALPYANGELHLGHLVEHIQTDIWVRAQKMNNVECYSVCGIDAHGTPIMLKAQQMKIDPVELTENMRQKHMEVFEKFHIAYDIYHTTHCTENKELAEDIFKKLQAAKAISEKEIEQLFDPQENIFLPDRFVKGTCPKCNADDQYGDNCESCGATYQAYELKNPRSVLSDSLPHLKSTKHFFFKLPQYKEVVKSWLENNIAQAEIKNKLDEWFSQGLQEWDITRDAPYFGFEIPNSVAKYFYVWLDAPIGYMAAFKKLCEQKNLNFDEFWSKDSTTKLYHFIGKDIVYFHTLFWPAVLYAANFRMPTSVFAHGFLTVNSKKMSKSRGTFITASAYAEHLDVEHLRYYFAAKLSDSTEDIDLNFADYSLRVNSDLVGKIVNIASRCAGFVTKKFSGLLSAQLPADKTYDNCLTIKDDIITAYTQRHYSKAMRMIANCADEINQYIDAQKPWVLAKDPQNLPQVHEVCTQALNCYRLLAAYLKPVLPIMAAKSEKFLNCEVFSWDNIAKPLLNHQIEKFQPLQQRVDDDAVNNLLEANI